MIEKLTWLAFGKALNHGEVLEIDMELPVPQQLSISRSLKILRLSKYMHVGYELRCKAAARIIEEWLMRCCLKRRNHSLKRRKDRHPVLLASKIKSNFVRHGVECIHYCDGQELIKLKFYWFGQRRGLSLIFDHKWTQKVYEADWRTDGVFIGPRFIEFLSGPNSASHLQKVLNFKNCTCLERIAAYQIIKSLRPHAAVHIVRELLLLLENPDPQK